MTKKFICTYQAKNFHQIKYAKTCTDWPNFEAKMQYFFQEENTFEKTSNWLFKIQGMGHWSYISSPLSKSLIIVCSELWIKKPIIIRHYETSLYYLDLSLPPLSVSTWQFFLWYIYLYLVYSEIIYRSENLFFWVSLCFKNIPDVEIIIKYVLILFVT